MRTVQEILLIQKILFIKNKLNALGEKITEEKLIVFDYRVILLFFVSVILFSVMILFKLHGSSIPYWNTIISDGGSEREGILVGSPRGIRSDEWLVQTPFMLSQVNQRDQFSIENKSLGQGNVPLLMGLPTKHLSSYFRPQNWGFFFLDSERGFSFYWGYKIFALFLSFFFLLMLVTKNNFWISFFGSVWLFFSSFIQWWFSIGLPEMIAAFSLIFIGASYVLVGKKKSSIVFGSLVLAIFSVNFVLFFYPAFQVPLSYLLLFMIIGFLIENFSFQEFKINLRFRIAAIALPLIISGGVLAGFYLDTKDTIALLMNTVYPGKRAFVNSKIALAEFFSGFYSIFMRENRFPAFLGNISEASSFVLLFPLAIVAAAANFFKKKKSNPILIMSLVYLILLSIWMLFSLPEGFSKFTLMGFVAIKRRALVGLGIGSIISLAVASRKNNTILKDKKILIAITSLVLLFTLKVGLDLWGQVSFMKQFFIFSVSAFIALLSYLFIAGKNKPFFFLAAVFAFAATFFVNPISVGLSPINNKEIIQFIRNENQKNPDSYWVFYGFHIFADLAKVSGAEVFNGTQYTPKLEKFKTLDQNENGKNINIYNRYAHIAFSDTGTNEPVFFLPQPDTVEIRINPCTEKLANIGINHYAFDYRPDEKILSCLKPLVDKPLSGKIWVYERR